MKKNYAAKVAANRQMYLDIGQDVGVQMMADFLTVTSMMPTLWEEILSVPSVF